MDQSSAQSRFWMLFETMLLMRRFEERVLELHEAGAFSGHYHVYIGQEATGAVAMSLLTERDQICTTHRNHGHLLARGADEKRALAEILGRSSGLNKGYAGTFHLSEPDLGFLSTSGIVGGAISLAVGGAFACRQRGDQSVTMALFGDGALEEGVAFEALNLAALWELPLVFLCENNDAQLWTGTGGRSQEHAVRDLCDLPRLCGMKTLSVEGLEIEELEAALRSGIDHCRSGEGPCFIEARTSRWPGNRTQFPQLVTGRTDMAMASSDALCEGEFASWYREYDPILRLARKLVSMGSETKLAEIDSRISERIDAAVQFAISSPFPDGAAALHNVFA